MSEHSRAKSMYEHDIEDSEVLRAEYRRPRDVLLSLVGEFMCKASNRLVELNKKNNNEGKGIELLDIRSHIVSCLDIFIYWLIRICVTIDDITQVNLNNLTVFYNLFNL